MVNLNNARTNNVLKGLDSAKRNLKDFGGYELPNTLWENRGGATPTGGKQLLLPNGSLTAPSLSFLNNKDSGLLFDGTSVHLSIDGTQTLTFGSSIEVRTDIEMQDNISLRLGKSADTFLMWNTTQTNDSVVWALGATSNTLILTQQGDEGFNFAHTNQTNPTLFIHSANQATNEWVSLTHNQTDAEIQVGSGQLRMRTHAYFNHNKELSWGNSKESSIDFSSDQATSNTLVWGLDNTSNSIIFTTKANDDQDHDHAGQTNPTIFIHSATDPDTANDQWVSLTHDVTNAVIGNGTGYVQLANISKADTGDPTGAEGLIYYNNADNVIKMYADGAWRALASW